MSSFYNQNMNIDDLRSIQLKLGDKVTEEPLPDNISIIAGYDSQTCKDSIIGYICYFDIDSLELVSEDYISIPQSIVPEYQPGFLSLRELPIFLALWEQRTIEPDVIVVDGNGILHPRRCGFATHLSYLVDLPSFGIAKNLLLGKFTEVAPDTGAYSEIVHKGDIIGEAVRTQSNSNPVFLSIGNKITRGECRELSLTFAEYRIPELTRQPDIKARKQCRLKTRDVKL